MNVFDHIIPDQWPVGISPLRTYEDEKKRITLLFELYLPGIMIHIYSDPFDATQLTELQQWKGRYAVARNQISNRINIVE